MNENVFYFHGEKNWPRTERKFIADSLLADMLIFGNPISAFDFAFSHPKLSEKLVRAEIFPRFKSVSTMIEEIQQNLFDELAMRTGKANTDLVAIEVLEAGYLIERSSLFAKFSAELRKSSGIDLHSLYARNVPTYVVERIKEKIASGDCRIQSVTPPFSDQELIELLQDLDPATGVIGFASAKLDEPRAHYEKHYMKRTKERLAFSVAHSLARSFLYAKHGFQIVPSEGKTYREGYRIVFSKLNQTLRQNMESNIKKEVMKQTRKNKSLQYLFTKQGDIHSLVDFPIANPMDMLRKEISADEIDEVILKVREKGKVQKIRSLLNKLHDKIEKGAIEEAADAKKDIEDLDPSLEINKELIEGFRQFDKDWLNKIDEKISQELYDLKWLKRPKTVFTRVGDAVFIIGVVSFFTSYIGLQYIIGESNSALMQSLQFVSQLASTEVMATRSVAWLLREKLASKVGLDFYAIFHDWPKASSNSIHRNK